MSEAFESFFDQFNGVMEDCERESEWLRFFVRKRIQEMVDFIGNFESWQYLNEDCKLKVIEYLDSQSRVKLGRCSKSEHQLVGKAAQFIHSIYIDDNLRYHQGFGYEKFKSNVFVTICFSSRPGKDELLCVFEQSGDQDTHIRWPQYMRKGRQCEAKILLKGRDHREESVEFFESWLHKCRYQVSRFSMQMINYPIEKSRVKFLPKCTHLEVRSDDENVYRWWLQKVPEHLEQLRLFIDTSRTQRLSSELLSSPQVLNTKEFFSMGRAPFSEEQWFLLKSNHVSFDSSNISNNAINRFIKRWVNGNLENKEFRSVTLTDRVTPDEKPLLYGLYAERVDNYFKIPSKADPCIWLRLDIDRDRVAISRRPYD